MNPVVRFVALQELQPIVLLVAGLIAAPIIWWVVRKEKKEEIARQSLRKTNSLKRELMVKVITLFALGLTLTLSASAQSTVKKFDYAIEADGGFWKELDNNQKIFYLSGFNSGFVFSHILLDSEGKLPKASLTIAQQVVAVDQCYDDDKRNEKLPISLCFAFAIGQANGVSREELAKTLAELRKDF